jgi:VanZ family protein
MSKHLVVLTATRERTRFVDKLGMTTWGDTIAAIDRRIPVQYWRWALVLAWMGVIFYLSSRSELPRPEGISASLEAIAGHFVGYGVLAVLVSFALAETGISTLRRSVYAVLIAVLYGVSDEFHQSLVPGRDPALFDIAMDAIGAITALAAWSLLVRWRRSDRDTA